MILTPKTARALLMLFILSHVLPISCLIKQNVHTRTMQVGKIHIYAISRVHRTFILNVFGARNTPVLKLPKFVWEKLIQDSQLSKWYRSSKLSLRASLDSPLVWHITKCLLCPYLGGRQRENGRALRGVCLEQNQIYAWIKWQMVSPQLVVLVRSNNYCAFNLALREVKIAHTGHLLAYTTIRTWYKRI